MTSSEYRRRVGIGIVDIWHEAFIGIAVRPLRCALTVLGVVLGIGSLVATVGLSQTGGRQILGRLDELRASEIVVGLQEGSTGEGADRLRWETDEVARMAGVRGAAALGTVQRPVHVARVLANMAGSSIGLTVNVVASSHAALPALRGEVGTGRYLNEIDERLGNRAVVLGSGLAERLGVLRLHAGPAVFLDNRAFVVVGVLDRVGREPDLLNAAIITPKSATDFGLHEPDRIVIDVTPDAMRSVASLVAVAINPSRPESLMVRVPPESPSLRRGVTDDVNALLVGLALLALIVGAVGIANVMLVNVMERTSEIGLRRALGASRRAIATQVLLEGAMLGAIGGVLGASLGVVITVGTAAVRDWIPVLSVHIPLIGPVIGSAIGLVACSYPAWRAARLEPVAALRLGP